MLALTLSRRMARAGFFYGWVVVAVTFFVNISMTGVMGMVGALILPLEREYGWSAEAISNALAVRILLFGLIAPFAAAFIERHGVRLMARLAIATVAIVLLLARFITEYWQLMALFGVALGIATGVTALSMSAIVATRWFTARRGLVVGMLGASTATGQLAFLPLAAWLESHWGWRAALLPSFAALALAALLVTLFTVERPADLRLNPFGETGPLALAPKTRPGFLTPFKVLRDVAPTPAFWALAGTFFVCGLSTNGLVQTHFIPLCADYGVSSVTAASMLALIGVFDFFGTIGSGWLSDRYDNRALLFVYYGLRGLSLLYLPYSSFTMVELSAFAVFYGLDWVATVPPTVKLTVDNYGRERTGVVFGWIFASHMVGAAFAASLGGYARTHWQTYLPAFYLAGVACLVAALAIWTIRRENTAPVLRPAE